MGAERWLPDADRAQPERIHVNLAALADLVGVMRTETNAGLRPESAEVRAGLGDGVCFGVRSASGYVYDAKHRYHESLTQAMRLLGQYLWVAEILTDAAEIVARKYAHTDALSAARTADVDKALAEAVRAARAGR
ncbi:MAG: hypothetical protein FWJ93_04865 [Micromonosporaceae bacterium]